VGDINVDFSSFSEMGFWPDVIESLAVCFASDSFHYGIVKSFVVDAAAINSRRQQKKKQKKRGKDIERNTKQIIIIKKKKKEDNLTV